MKIILYRILSLGLACIACSGLAFNANATSINAYTFNSAGSFESTATATVGFRFSTNESIMVTSFGIVDPGLNGLNSSHDIGIWSDAGTLLASVTINAGSADPLIDGFRYASIPSLLLSANETFRVAAVFHLGDGDNYISSVTRSSAAEITLIDNFKYSSPGGVLSFPGSTSLPESATANFQFMAEGYWGECGVG